MHELSVTEGLIKIVDEEAKSRNIKKISRINLVIGDLNSIIDDSVQFYFDILSKGTAAAGAVLYFRRIAPEFSCRSCGNIFEQQSYGYKCPKCEGKGIVVNKGQEFYIESIEVDTDED
jgi:hydrogenase nickel incorporation protein HypA/HybF